MLSIAAEAYLRELLDEDTFERSKVLNVFMAEELITRKDRFTFEDTTYVIGTLTRNRLLSKKQSNNESFVSNVIYIEMGQFNMLIEAILAKEDQEIDVNDDNDANDDENDENDENDGCEGDQNFLVYADDLDLPNDPEEEEVKDDEEDKDEDTHTADSTYSPRLQGTDLKGQMAYPPGVPLVTIHYIPRKHLSMLTEVVIAGVAGPTLAEIRQKVREYFER